MNLALRGSSYAKANDSTLTPGHLEKGVIMSVHGIAEMRPSQNTGHHREHGGDPGACRPAAPVPSTCLRNPHTSDIMVERRMGPRGHDDAVSCHMPRRTQKSRNEFSKRRVTIGRRAGHERVIDMLRSSSCHTEECGHGGAVQPAGSHPVQRRELTCSQPKGSTNWMLL